MAEGEPLVGAEAYEQDYGADDSNENRSGRYGMELYQTMYRPYYCHSGDKHHSAWSHYTGQIVLERHSLLAHHVSQSITKSGYRHYEAYN